MPFDNTVATLMLSVDNELRPAGCGDAAEEALQGLRPPASPSRVARVPGGSRRSSSRAASHFRKGRRLRVVMPDFLARGGDGLGPAIADLPAERVDLGTARPLNFRDALVSYWKARRKPLVAPRPGRITFLEDPAKCGAQPGDPTAKLPVIRQLP